MPGLVAPNQADGTWASPSSSLTVADLPLRVDGPLVWDRSDFKEISALPIVTLSEADVNEIEHAENSFRALDLNSSAVSRETFPLSRCLADKLETVSESVHNGVGFGIIKGLNSKKYSHESNVLIFAGLSSYVATERQDLCHIYNKEPDAVNVGRTLRPPNRSVAMNFHTDVDAGDVLAFMVQGKAKSGGLQRLASFPTVYNTLMSESPEVIETLAQAWRFEMPWCNGVEVINRPLLYYHNSRLLFMFATAFIMGSVYDNRLPDCPPLTERQTTAIQAVIDACWKHALEIDLGQGDLLFANNFALLHQRDAFVDDAIAAQVRHLLCLMLRDRKRAWDQPVELKVFIDARFAAPGARLLPTVDQWEAFRSEAGGRPRVPQNQSGASRSDSGSSSQSTQSLQSSASRDSTNSNQATQYPPAAYSASPTTYTQQQQQQPSGYQRQGQSAQFRSPQGPSYLDRYQPTQARVPQRSASQYQTQQYQPAQYNQQQGTYQQPQSSADTTSQQRRQAPSRSTSQSNSRFPSGSGSSGESNPFNAYAEKHD